MENTHMGSTFDSFLAEEGIFEEVEVAAKRRVMSLSLKPQICTRNSGHDGPCNGFPCTHVKRIMAVKILNRARWLCKMDTEYEPVLDLIGEAIAILKEME